MPEDRHSGVPGGNGSGADVKSGIELDIDDNSSRVVSFGTAFASVPNVVVSFTDAVLAVDIPHVATVTAANFQIRIHKGHGGSGHSWDVAWIATDAGDP